MPRSSFFSNQLKSVGCGKALSATKPGTDNESRFHRDEIAKQFNKTLSKQGEANPPKAGNMNEPRCNLVTEKLSADKSGLRPGEVSNTCVEIRMEQVSSSG